MTEPEPTDGDPAADEELRQALDEHDPLSGDEEDQPDDGVPPEGDDPMSGEAPSG